jgi:hypothetical protein
VDGGYCGGGEGEVSQMDLDRKWSHKIANSVVEELVRGNVLTDDQWKRAEAIAEQQIFIHLISGDRPEGFVPPRTNSN